MKRFRQIVNSISPPPPKRRKLKSSSSSSMAESDQNQTDDDSIGSKGVKKTEFVTLIADALHSLGYHKTCEFLHNESGITQSSSVLHEFSQQILDGNWDQSLNSLRKLSIPHECVFKSLHFAILEQKFLELLHSQNPNHALTTLRTEISPLLINHNRIRELSWFLLSSGQRQSQSQTMVNPKPRSELLYHLQNLFPPNVIPPQGRLLNLVEQAIDSQQDSCLFHNSSKLTSLFIDHNCGKDQIPSQTLQILREHKDEIWFLRFSHNGKFLASTSKDKSAIIWEVDQEKGELSLKHKLLGHTKPVSCVSWSPNDDQILTCGVEDVIRRWNVVSGECLRVYQKNYLGLVSCCWSPQGDHVFSGCTDKSIIMWDLDGNELESWPMQRTVRISDLEITSDGQFLVSVCKENMISIFNRSPIVRGNLIKENSNIVSFTLSDDKKLLLISLVNQEIHLWRIHERLRALATYKGHKVSRFVVRACFGGLDQAFVASGSEDSRVFIWHRDSGELLKTLVGHSGAVNCTSWNPVNPHMLASASDDRTIRIWGLNHVD